MRNSIMTVSANNAVRFLGRQAILDSDMHLFGYELLFRSGTENVFSGDSEDATNQVIDSFLSMVSCFSPRNLFINCTREVLVNMSVRLLPSSSVILEILETVNVDDELVKACKILKHDGYRLALDDFIPQKYNRELVDLADFIKVDFRAAGPDVRQEIYDMTRNRPPVFVAEKVETADEVKIAKAEGNVLFQGYFYSKPEIISEPQIAPNKRIYLQVLSALAKPVLDTKEVEHLLQMEPSLCYRLLRLANSALYGFRFRISTIRGALIAVGDDAFRRLVTVALAGSLPNNGPDMAVRQALERATFCESLAPILNENPAELYMVGMLSMMDQMLSIPMKQLLHLVCLSSQIEDVLLGARTGLGSALELCEYYEHASNNTVPPYSDRLLHDSASRYFKALLSTGSALHALGR
jgi:EAL and modified HD-GYP domain-containing signal transduction protein